MCQSQPGPDLVIAIVTLLVSQNGLKFLCSHKAQMIIYKYDVAHSERLSESRGEAQI